MAKIHPISSDIEIELDNKLLISLSEKINKYQNRKKYSKNDVYTEFQNFRISKCQDKIKNIIQYRTGLNDTDFNQAIKDLQFPF